MPSAQQRDYFLNSYTMVLLPLTRPSQADGFFFGKGLKQVFCKMEVSMNRPYGVCNCPFRSGFGVAVCSLDGQRCRIFSGAMGLYCRGWLPDGSPSPLQAQGSLFGGVLSFAYEDL